VRVVDRQQQRPLAGQAGADPVQTVQDLQRAGRPRRRPRRLGPQHRRRHAGGAIQLRPLPFQELAHHAEGQLALQLRAAGAAHRQPVLAPQPAGGLQQPGLADPGGALDQQQAAPPGSRRRGQRPDPGQLGLPLEQLHSATPRLPC
jgi:hypothetical protein